MGSLLEGMLRWTYRHFLSLLLIIAVLLIGGFLKGERERYRSASTDLLALSTGRGVISDFLKTTERETVTRIGKLRAGSLQQLESRLAVIERDIQQKRSEKEKKDTVLDLLSGRPLGASFVASAKLDIEIAALQQEWDYLNDLRALMKGPVELEQLRQAHAAAYALLTANQSNQAQLRQRHPVAIHVPGTNAHRLLAALQAAEPTLIANNQRAYDGYMQKRSWLISVRQANKQFAFRIGQFDRILQPIDEAIQEHEDVLSENWWRKLVDPVMGVLPTALQVLLSIILIPIGIKAIFYFILAPLASRRPPICILPGESGIVDGITNDVSLGHGQVKHSFVSLKVEIERDEELLVHPEYVQSSTITGRKETKWLLDYAYPWSSLLSGMFALTRVRTDHRESIVMSATKDPFSELGVISLPAGAAVVLQPRCLIGVSYRTDQPARISRHWRLSSLHAWLTLQLRYLVFHGPAKLIVKGCRGVRIEKAGAGRRINQAATMGFSASLHYSTFRCETFASYLMGKQELLDDSFDGKNGYYIYEEIPNFGKPAGVTARGLEGLTDSVLKILGI